MADTANSIHRDYEMDGVPASGRHKVKKSDNRRWGTWVETIISAFTSNGGLIYTSKASMDADLQRPAKSSAWVIGDETVANNGVYQKQGGSGSGSWTRVADLPYSFVNLADTGAGTANAIQLTSSIPTSASVLRVANIFETNTGNVTLSENGGAAKSLLTNGGNQIAPGGLVAGMMITYIDSGATFRLLSDQASAAVVAAAEAAQAAAEAARDVAVAAAATADPLATHTFSVVLAQTSVTISGGYTVGKVATVHLNGVEIDGWTASTGTTVTFPAITDNDIADGESSATMKVRIGTSVIGLAGLDGRYLRTTSVETLTEERQEFVVTSLGLDAKFQRISSMSELPLNLVGLLPANTAAQNKTAVEAGLAEIAAKTLGGALVIPPGLHDCDGGIAYSASKSLTIRGVGHSSRIEFVSSTYGLDLDAGTEGVFVNDAQLNAKNTSAGFLKILKVRGLSKGGTRVDRMKMLTLGTAAATIGIQVGRTENFRASDNFGRLAGGAVTEGYAADGAGYLFDLVGEIGVGTDFLIKGNRADSTGAIARIRPNGVVLSPKLEGITFRDNIGVGVARGYDLVGDISTGYRTPLFRFLGGHINAKNFGVYANGVAQVVVDGILIYIEGLVAGLPVHIENCVDAAVRNNEMYNLGSADFSAIYVKDTNGCEVFNNRFQSSGGSYMVTLQAGAVNFGVGDNVYRRISGVGPVYENLGGVSNIDRGGNRLL